jgi:hypothetical protein
MKWTAEMATRGPAKSKLLLIDKVKLTVTGERIEAVAGNARQSVEQSFND